MLPLSNAADVVVDNDTLDYNTFPDPKPILKFKEDPIALACGSYRLWLEHPSVRWTELDHVNPTDADRLQAKEIREYYRGRLTFDTLKHGTPLTEFKRKLNALMSNALDITSKEVGILYRLPYFYAEDIAHDEVFASVKVPKQTRLQAQYQEGEFKLIKRVLRSRASGDYVQFWFTSNISPAAYQLTVKADNPLIVFAESIFKQPSVRLSANMFYKHLIGRKDCRYYAMGGVKVI